MISTLYFFYDNDNGYNLSFVTVDTTYNRVKPVFDDIISTFYFKN